ncbi:MAG: tetratricopeptide repeat protein [Muribaculaceae bacterium]|nr:tetratricopeptide repeat protein [Muribaculaceae bacterium]
MTLFRNNISFSLRFSAVILLAALSLLTTWAQDGSGEGLTSRYYSSRAENYENAGSWEAAKREIDAGLAKFPDNPDLRYLNGRYYYYAVGDLEQARYNLVKSIQSDDQNFKAKRLMVDIEDEAKRYSSAICYINELLEFQPYDRDMWRRKIALYNKIGHRTEADQALTRLARIYPNDSIVQRDLNARNKENWISRLSSTPLDERSGLLESWIDLDNRNIEYYTELVNVYRQVGDYDRAIGAANRGLRWFPSNGDLTRLVVSMLTEMGQLTRALNFAREHRMGTPIYNNLLREVADDARMRDPYEANGRLYLATGDTIALRYLLNTSITRGYYDDAIVYLNEAYNRFGRTPDLLYKEYTLEKRFGDEKGVMRVLQQINQANFTIDGLDDEFAAMLIDLANREIENGDYESALDNINRALERMWPTNEAWASTVAKKITLLGRLNRFADARWAYEVGVIADPSKTERFAAAYDEVAAARLKILIENEQYNDALNEALDLLKVMPYSEAGLRTVINMSQTLKNNEMFYEYAAKGYETYPDQPYFIVKQASALMQQGKPEEALAILKPRKGDDYLNPHIYAAFSGITEEWAGMLIKEKMPRQAIDKIDAALMYDPTNKELHYLKGLAYELLKDYGRAYDLQKKYYNPSNAEQAEWYQHMRYLQYRSFSNRVEANYTSAFFDSRNSELTSRGHLFSIASVSYSRQTASNNYTGQISYKGVDGYIEGQYVETGGIGLEFMAQWDHTFNHRWSMSASASYGLKYFNTLGANISASYSADRDWTPSLKLGYRLTPTDFIYSSTTQRTGRYHVAMLTPSCAKSWERINTSLDVSLIALKEVGRANLSFHYNVGWKGKLFFNEDNISSISLLAGFGSFPELTFFDNTGLGNFSKVNAMVGFDVQYLFSSHFYMGLLGAWNTYYNPLHSEALAQSFDAYRNVYSINVQFHLSF